MLLITSKMYVVISWHNHNNLLSEHTEQHNFNNVILGYEPSDTEVD